MKKHIGFSILIMLEVVVGLMLGLSLPPRTCAVTQNSGFCEQALPVAGISRINLTTLEVISLDTTVEVEKNQLYEVTLPSNPYQAIIDSLTEEEKELLYNIVMAESGGQRLEGQRAVIEVIFNRMLSDDFPDTLKGVLSQKGQFCSWGTKKQGGSTQEEALELVYTKKPLLTEEHVYFSKSKFNYADNYIKIQDHWFGTKK